MEFCKNGEKKIGGRELVIYRMRKEFSNGINAEDKKFYVPFVILHMNLIGRIFLFPSKIYETLLNEAFLLTMYRLNCRSFFSGSQYSGL